MKELLNKIIYAIEETIPEEEEWGAGRLRASMAGKKPRYLAFELTEAPRAPRGARTEMTFKTGDAVHDILRDKLAESYQFEVLDRELELVHPELPNVKGHIDLRLKDVGTQRIFLVDIKTVDQMGFIFNDPNNEKKTRYFTARNYTFDSTKWREDPFKRDYLYQVSTYARMLDAIDKVFDTVAFVVVCKATGHIAVSIFDNYGIEDALYKETILNFNEAYNTPNPYAHAPCWPLEENDMLPLQCQYCAYRENCYIIDTEIVRGRPKQKAVGIRSQIKDN